MARLYKRHGATRQAFTLVELLVVMTLMLVLASLAVLFVPRALEQEKATTGARMLVGWLQTARANALRDQAPRGVRLLPYTDQTGTLQGFQVRQLQYIQQPPDYVAPATPVPAPPAPPLTPPVRPIMTPNGSPPPLDTVQLQPDPLLPGFSGGLSTQADYPVQPLDYLEISGGGLLYKIIAVSDTSLKLNRRLPGVLLPTKLYRIIRSPRVSGDDPLDFPLDVGIDLTHTGQGYDLPGPLTGDPTTAALTGTKPWFDILFAPSGAVVGEGAAYDKIVFWVRDLTQPNLTDNEPQLVCIYTRSGAIAVHPVDVSGSNYYTFTTDGRSSGE